MSERSVVIVSAARTPIGSFSGCLSSINSSDLGAIVIKEVLTRANLKGEDVSEVIFGQVLTAGQGQNTSRLAAVKAGIPEDVPAFTLNMLCGSGMKSVFLGYSSIMTGLNDIVVCGGQESMSQAPHAYLMRPGVKIGHVTFVDTLLHDGLVDTTHNLHMGITAENLRRKYNISREEQDEFATESQNKVENAQKSGHFQKEIVPVEVTSGRTTTVISTDEFPRPGTTVEKLAKLRPAFEKDGTVTAGNASGVNDGAAAVVLMDSKTAEERGLKPLGVIRGLAQVGVEAVVMGIAPVKAVNKLLKVTGWKLEDVDLIELNEAFASQSLACIRELKLDSAKVNVSGGAVALGHPVGASGCRVLVTLLHAMERLNKKKGIATLCIGGGMGIAMAVERL